MRSEGLLQWPHSGCHVHAGVGVSEDDRPFALRLARYRARNQTALDGPTAGTAALDPLELLSPGPGDDALPAGPAGPEPASRVWPLTADG
jgi:hypothetical protein